MSISVNDVEITDDAVERELPHHAHAAAPLKSAVEALVLREVLLQAARDKVQLAQEELRAVEAARQPEEAEALLEDALIERLIAMEVSSPAPTAAECETYYRNNPERFRNGELVEASHILFQVTPNVPLEALRAKAEEVLQQVRQHPAQFKELARTYSNCTSAEVGGNLGQMSRGQTVPEFERVIFSLQAGETAPRLVESRFGLHIVRVEHRVAGQILPYEMVREQLAQYLQEQARTRALQQYLKLLVGQARIHGVELAGADSPLLQ